MKKIFLSFILLITSASVFASAASDLNAKLTTFNSMTASFTQTVQSSDGTVLQNSKGNLALQRPGKFRWVVRSPMQQVIITDGKTLWIYEPDLKQATVRPLANNVGQAPLLLLTKKDAALQNAFDIKALKPGQYELTAKDQNEGFKNVIITFKSGKIKSLDLLNQLGQSTMIKFYNVKINANLKASLFQFRAPKGVDVIKQ